MALANYTDLVNSLNSTGGWLHRNDMGSIIPDMIKLCEVTINYGDLATLGVEGLRTLDQETQTTLTTTPGVQTVTLPTDFLGIRKIYVILGGTRIELVELPTLPMAMDERWNGQSVPRHFIISGGNLVLYPIPDQAYQIPLLYFASVPPLTAATPTNWLMTKSPGVYLSGTIVHGASWMGPNFNPAPFVAAFKSSMKQLTRMDNLKRSGMTTLRSEPASLNRSPFNILTGV